ncbi:MAG: endonuclease/exonuclease/phosphatase family protein [Solirubrobacterales bacterium]
MIDKPTLISDYQEGSFVSFSTTVRRTATALLAIAAVSACIGAAMTGAAMAQVKPATDIRFATFNASLNRGSAGQLVSDLSTPANAQARAVAEIIQRSRPDVILINEFDYAPAALALFQDNYLSIGQNGARPITYAHRFSAPSNTGLPSGHDLDNNGSVGGPGDAQGFGFFPGQFGMAVYSRFPIDESAVRTFQTFRWKDMPGALLPDDPATPEPADWYSGAELDSLRLSSKSHWDLPIKIGARVVHLLASHPTPPVFDGPEDRNGRRNFDEIRFWSNYVRPGRGNYIYDDAGAAGGLKPGAAFVIAGDQNSDPLDGDSLPGSIAQLLENPRVNSAFTPSSPGAVEQSALQGGANATHRGDPAFDTADFADGAPGNLRVDYVLPSRSLHVAGGGVFWPLSADPLFAPVGVFPFPSSDHRLVWLDAGIPGSGARSHR